VYPGKARPLKAGGASFAPARKVYAKAAAATERTQDALDKNNFTALTQSLSKNQYPCDNILPAKEVPV